MKRNAFYYFVRDKLGIHWRRWLTGRFLDSYFTQRHYYELNANAGIDNPDQRIAEDINTFTQRSLFFLLILIGAILQLAAFSNVLWSISRELVYFLVFYAFFGTFVTLAVFGKVLLGLNFMQLRREADFRFGMVRIRENAESIAFYRGEAQESQQVRRRFAAAFDNYNRLLSAISVIVENFEGLSRFAAGVDRLNTFSRVLAVAPAGRARSSNLIKSAQGDRLALEQVTLMTPGGERTLVKNLSLEVGPGEGLMIVGESGSGKSSLLRAIAGLWYCGDGRIVRPPPQDMLFLPQQPYMILGALRSQLLYPY